MNKRRKTVQLGLHLISSELCCVCRLAHALVHCVIYRCAYIQRYTKHNKSETTEICEKVICAFSLSLPFSCFTQKKIHIPIYLFILIEEVSFCLFVYFLFFSVSFLVANKQENQKRSDVCPRDVCKKAKDIHRQERQRRKQTSCKSRRGECFITTVTTIINVLVCYISFILQ